ncbi:MAG: helix-turn-helix domain-containing protein [Cytophagaceae bacterium]|nr:helix-turn-helix domain-containing protein [Cytophagaceae bacterium]MBK9509977.1 helix-turn-helix domain-containing protein [Cytophagaceae bacterium]MBK9933604.1 helix-turn-helix domain-containing protein [Cytophagaceae bacterium]MBL0302682.1 helix-turn-helix domain-containing protein [Cytophagaceae bacterium]MBL0325506.1 helix-turn-helix domain-containing protein [Cytophagaceae bacterium]
MVIEFITKDEFSSFKEELIQELKSIFAEKTSGKKWLKSSEVRKMLSISAGTLQTLRSNGTLPYTKIGGTMYYELKDVESILINNKISA